MTLLVLLSLGGCAGMTQTEQRTLSGAGIGAAGGALIGSMYGNMGAGAAIGSAVGGGAGYLYGKHKEEVGKAYQNGYQQGQESK